MSFLTVNGARFNVQRFGRGERTVVFLHGLVLDNLSSWYYTVANPVAKRADVVLYDLRGHGLSEITKTGYRVEDSVSDLVGILDALGIPWPVILVGNSYGGLVALAFARDHPERTAGLAFVEAHFVVEGWHDKMTAKLEFAGMKMNEAPVREWLEHKSQRNHERRFRKADSLMWETSLVDDLRAARPVTEAELRALSVPVLALYGEHSDVLDRGHDLRRLVRDCELHVLPGGTHSILMENTPWVRDRILGWLDRVLK